MDKLFGVSFEAWRKGKLPLLDSWPLFDSPLLIASILSSYLIFVLHLGPKFMKSRKAINLKLPIILYNAVQVGYNFYTWQQLVVQAIFWKRLFSFGCARLTEPELQVYPTLYSRLVWHLTMTKVLDLLDTVFFVLSKKQNKITFLHVQHHFLTLSIIWTSAKYWAGEEFIMAFCLNTLVHVVMYFYYFLASLGPEYKQYLWWKKYLTIVQIVQFFIVIAYSTASLWLSCGYSQTIVLLFIGNISLNLVLFLNFFFKTYGSKAASKKRL
ncbi:Elongation of very long chain fatty acids protein 4 [Pseudolycoriella hygida]|uniref:Elongation of very long chain fatty acids protein n=1 Tax=Pseudolycoriella hygida TaxID=35572 RepID=A0A9Q0N6E5_9DIPT|nr:Elongation of very long chain fatty acids protein 4 [Pseudolycoriella hygida]